MSDDRNWNFHNENSIESNHNAKSQNDKRLIRNYALSIIESETQWDIVFKTQYGESSVVYSLETRKWKKKRGKAHGLGAVTMLNYLKPTKEVEGNY